MTISLSRRVAGEFLGTAFLVAAVVGSGIMGDRLAGGNVALALLANTIATGAALVTLIIAFGPVSGAHLNPVVTFMDAFEGGLPWSDTLPYVSGQVLGGLSGAVIANLMFELPAISLSGRARNGSAQLLSEFVATFGLLCVIWGASRLRSNALPFAVGGYIMAAYWFTASTSFANPAVTIARCVSNTFAGIRPVDVPWFVIAQFLGGIAATLMFRWLVPGLQARVEEVHVADGFARNLETERTIADEWPGLSEILERRDVVLGMKEAVNQRLAHASDEEQSRAEALSNRSLHPQCEFDRRHRLNIYALALAPDEVGWIFKIRERIHRLHCDHS